MAVVGPHGQGDGVEGDPPMDSFIACFRHTPFAPFIADRSGRVARCEVCGEIWTATADVPRGTLHAKMPPEKQE